MIRGKALRAILVGTVVMLIAAAAPVLAQTGAASVTGLITDESGAPVPGVTITATNQATNVTYTAVSNEAGNYTITALPIGMPMSTAYSFDVDACVALPWKPCVTGKVRERANGAR